MVVPIEHRGLLILRNFPLPTQVAGLRAEQLHLLQRYGFWLRALARGTITPFTKAQVHFVAAAQGRLKAETPYELAWCAAFAPPSKQHAACAPSQDDCLIECECCEDWPNGEDSSLRQQYETVMSDEDEEWLATHYWDDEHGWQSFENDPGEDDRYDRSDEGGWCYPDDDYEAEASDDEDE